MTTTGPELTMPEDALLDGLQVLEVSRGLAGAYCGRLLVQLGAQVTRIGPALEAPGSAEARPLLHAALHARKTLLPLGGGEMDGALEAALARAQAVIVEHDERSDAFDGVAGQIRARCAQQPSKVLVVLSGNGASVSHPPGCALTSAAWSALSWAIGEPAREPLTPAYGIVDYQAGTHAAGALLAALAGDFDPAAGEIDIASRDVASHLVSALAQNYLPFGRPWQRDGRRPFMSGGIYPLGLFECKDGLVALYVRSADQWHGILRAMGDPAWGQEERFRDPRVVARQHGEEADSHLLPWLARHTKDELMALGIAYGFPAAPVGTVRETLDNPQFAYRASLAPLSRPSGAAPVRVPTSPWRLQSSTGAAAAGRAWPIAPRRCEDPSRLLEGLRVLDLSWVWSGPLVGSFLTDLGAEVIKIEHPSRLDSVRQRGRPLRDGQEVPGPVEELNPWFNQLNHGKRSVVLDIKQAQDRARLMALARDCDVVLENMRPGALPKLGLGYADFAEANPSVVMLSMSLIGQQGPLSEMKGYAGIMTSMAGLESLVGYPDPQGHPYVVGMAKTALGDPNAAAHGVTVLLAALHRRRRTGQGTWIDLSQTDAVLSVLAGPLIESQLHGDAPVPGNTHPLHAPHGHFPCLRAGEWVAIAVQSQRQWQGLLAAADDARLSAFAALDAPARVAQRAAIEQALADWTARHSRDEVVSCLSAAGVPAAPVASYQDMTGAEWRRDRALTRRVSHPWIGEQDIAATPWRYGERLPCADRGAPLLGEGTQEVLGRLADTALRA